MNPTDFLSKYFNWHDALWLPQFDCCHIPSQTEINNIIRMANKMDTIRRFLGCPLIVHVWIRPILNNPESPHHGQDTRPFRRHTARAHVADIYGKILAHYF